MANMTPTVIKLILINLFFFNISMMSQHKNWLQIADQKDVSSIASEGDSLWIGTHGYGLILFEKKSKMIEYFNNANSGLPHNDINFIFVDTCGNKWIQTKNGLVIFNGKSWNCLDSNNLKIHKNIFITDAVYDKYGAIWFVGSDVMKYMNNEWFFFDESNSDGLIKNEDQIKRVETNSFGDIIWFLKSSEIIEYHSITNRWKIYDKMNTQMPNNPSFYDFTVVKQVNYLWFIGPKKISRFNGINNYIEIPEADDTYKDTYFYDIKCDIDNKIWLASSRGVFTFDPYGYSAWKQYIYEFQKSVNCFCPWAYVNCVHVDKENRKWFGYSVDTIDLYQFDDKKWYKYDISNFEFQINNISDIKQIESGEILISTYFDGIYLFNGKIWSSLFIQGMDQFTNIYSFISNNSHELIFATSSGLFSYKDSKWTVIDTTDRIKYGLQFIDKDRYGNLWATGSRKIYYITKSNCVLKHQISDNNFIRDLKIDKQNRIWIATDSSIIKYENFKWSEYSILDKNLNVISFTTINADNVNKIYFGSKTNGIYVIYNGINFNVIDSLGFNCKIINKIVFDSNGTEWFCTDNGVIKISTNKLEHFLPSNSGLSNEMVNAMIIDSNQNKWFSAKGISIFDETGTFNFKFNDNSSSHSMNFSLKAYPNPAISSVKIEIDVPIINNVSISIYDVKGVKIENLEQNKLLPGKYYYLLDINRYSIGTYLISMFTENGQFVEKFIKIKKID